MQDSIQGGTLYIVGGDSIRFLVEEPARMALDGLKVESFDNDASFSNKVSRSSVPTSPVCLIANRDSLGESPSVWLNEKRSSYPWLPIVLLENQTTSGESYNFFPELIEAVSVIQHPYTQKAVIDAIENSLRWSLNLCRLFERVRYFSNLTERELAIVSMATDGLPNKSMARRLEVSIKTIEKNRRSAYEKLKISSSAEMAALVTFRRYFNRNVTTAVPAAAPASAGAPFPFSTHTPAPSSAAMQIYN